MLYRIAKILNHNSFMGIQDENNQECLVMGKGVAFGKKVGQTVPVTAEAKVYSLKEMTERGEAKDILKSVSPLCLEFANEVLNQAEQEFGKVDRTILFTMADHLDFAIRRIQNGEQISNPLTDDIRVMFYKEYKVASCIQELLKEKLQLEIDEHEIGYIALHVHAAIVDENVSQAMEIARTVRECISLVEKETGNSIDVMSLGYNRLMNHVRYMVARAIHGEKLKMNLNEYMKEHVYMYSSENAFVKFRIVKAMISDVIDLFGKGVKFSEETDTHVSVSVHVNERAAEQFAKNYAPDVVILQPKRLRDKLRDDLKKAWEAYED